MLSFAFLLNRVLLNGTGDSGGAGKLDRASGTGLHCPCHLWLFVFILVLKLFHPKFSTNESSKLSGKNYSDEISVCEIDFPPQMCGECL